MPATKKKCICQLCTCGRHMCPHRKKEQLVLGSEQTSAKALSQEDKRKHRKQWEVPNDKQDLLLRNDQLNTTFVLSESTSLATALTVDDKGNSKSSGLRSESKSWSAKQTPKTLPIRRPDNLKSEGSADFTTTHQHDFNEKKSDSYAAGSFEAASATVQAESWNKKQIPRTQKIKKADTLILSGPLNLETTHQSEYSESILKDKTALGESNLKQTYQRPKTSLKLGGEFQSDSSYQQAFTHKIAEDGVKVQKGVSKGHLKPEGEMTFDTTSLDYNAVSTHVSRASEQGDGLVVLKPKRSRPQSEIKIASGTISDETTLVSDFKRWNVEKPTRHKPADTLQIGDTEEMDSMSTRRNADSLSRFDASKIETSMSDHANWQVSRPVVQRPQNNLKPEGDFHFDTTHDIDYNSRSKRTSVLEPLTERTETESIGMDEGFANETVVNESITDNTTESRHVAEIRDTEKRMDISQKAMISTVDGAMEQEVKANISADGGPTKQEIQANIADDDSATKHEIISDIANRTEQKVYEDNNISQSEEQGHYVTWDEIRPKPIRPHSNLRQEGGMQFDTTNRSEFISRSMERVKGIRPKTSTKLFDGDFDATTMNQVMFSSNQAEKVSPIRPVSNLHVEKGGFNDETTSSREFQPWKIERPAPIVPRSNLAQEGTMDFTTTNNTEFEEKRPEKVSPIRPTTTNKISGGDIELTTTNRVMHSEFPLERVQKIVPQSTLRMNSGVFDSETTNMSQFQEWEIDRPKAIRPVPNLTQEGSMDFTTMNQMQFEEKAIERVTQFRPHTSSKITGDFEGVTTNQIMFAAHPLQRPNMIKPKGNLEVEKGKFATDTTNHIEFQQWQQSKPDPVTPRNNLQQEGSCDFTTTNQVQYGEKSIDRVSEIRPKTNTKTIGDFDGTTTNQVMFQDSPREKLKAIRPQNNIQLEKGKFATDTTNHTEFQQWQQSKSDSVTPRNNLQQEGSRDFTTTNQVQYGAKPIDRVSEIRPKTNTKTIGEFDGTTTNQVMYQDSPREKLKAIRPQNNIQLEKGNFNTETTNNIEYQKWEYSKPSPIKPHSSMRHEGSMDFTTTNDTDFMGKTAEKLSPIKPSTMTKMEGKFEGVTTNQAMFKSNTIERVKGKRPSTNIHVEKGKIENETTASREFQQWEINRPQQVKPTGNLIQEGEMDFTTSNQTDFARKPITKIEVIRPHASSPVSGDFAGTKFEDITTNQAMYKSNTVERVKGKRPTTNLHVEKGKIEDQTTASKEFQQWEINRPEQVKPTGNLIQEGEMDFTTSNQTDFPRKTITKMEAIRPHASSPLSGDFDGTTTNQVMFQGQTMDKIHDIRPKDNLRVDSGHFNEETTTSKEYGYKKGNKLEAIKPKSSLTQEGQFDFITSNQTQFEEKTINKVSQIRPKTETKTSDEKFDSITTNQAMFQTPAMNTVHEIRPSDNLHVEGGKFQSQTTSSDEYQQWKVQKPTAFQLASSLKQEGSMQFETTNNAEFKERSFDRVQQIRPKTTNKISEGEFESTTTNQMMFQQPSKLERVKPIRHQNNLQVESGKFDKETTNSRDFRQWVKMENKDSQSKRKLQAAGVRTQQDSPVSKKDTESQQVKGENEQSGYQPWKLNEESSTMQAQSAKVEQQGSDHIDVTNTINGKSTYQNQQVHTVGSGNLAVTSTNVAQQLNRSSNKNEIQIESPQKALGITEQNAGSTMASDYAGKQTIKTRAIIPSGNISNEGEMTFSTTSQSDYVRQTGSRTKQENAHLINNGKSGNMSPSSPNADQLDRSPKIIEIQSPRKTINTIERKQQKMESTSTMASDYAGKQTTKTRAIIPSGNIANEGEMTFSTTSQSDYVRQTGSRHKQENAHLINNGKSGNMSPSSPNVDQQDRSPKRIEIQSPRKTMNTIERKQLKMENSSTMASDYAGKQTTKTRAIIPSGNISSEGEMTFSTTSKSDYARQTGSRYKLVADNSKSSEARGRTQSNILHQDSNLNSLKTSGNEVILNSTETQVKGGSKAQNETAQFKSSGASMSLIDSSPQKVATSRAIRRSKPDDNLKIESVPFDGTSTTKTEYTRIEGRRSSSKKPSESLKQEGKMVFNTTSNDYSLTEAYNAGRVAIKAKSKKEQRGSLGQSGTMDFHTTSNSSYTGNFGSKSKNLRPQSSIKLGGDETSYESMSSTRSNPEMTSTRQYQNVTSTSQASYVGHTPTRTRAHRPTTSQRIGEGSFEGQTTSRVSFGAQERVEKSKAIKPANHNILNTENGSTGGTTYKNSFDAVKGHHCPVLDLQAGGSLFTVTEEKNGHIFYAQQVQG